MTEYHLIFGQLIRKSTCLIVIAGFFAVKFNYLTTNCLFCSAFEYKNSTLIPKPFMKHQKLKENHQKLKHFLKKKPSKYLHLHPTCILSEISTGALATKTAKAHKFRCCSTTPCCSIIGFFNLMSQKFLYARAGKSGM